MLTVPPSRLSSEGEHHECVVVGAGLLGLSAAWALSHRGLGVLVLDTDVPGHERAGSKGNARIFRLSYPEPLYVQMAAQARDVWRNLEAQSGRSLLEMTGLVSFGHGLPVIAEAMARSGSQISMLSAAESAERFPHLDIAGPSLFEEGSGVLAADECLGALLGADTFELRTDAAVVALENGRNEVTVHLRDGGSLTADVAVNCAGPAALALMPGVRAPMAAAPSLQQVVYLRPDEEGNDIPLFIEWGDDTVYGLPVTGQRLLKLSHHSPGPAVDPDDLSLSDDPDLTEMLLDAAARLLPTFIRTPVATERCLYDNTRDADFILDRVGRIVIGCGTSGHGFKFGPLLGEAMADLVCGTQPPFPLERFAVNRSHLRALPNP
jgi:sarcosine oxidase